MAIKWDQVVAESIVGTAVSVGTFVIIGIPTYACYKIGNWWMKRKYNKEVEKLLKNVEESWKEITTEIPLEAEEN